MISEKYEKDVSIDDLLNEAIVIYEKTKNNITLKDAQKQHPQFAKSYPIVLRYMCDMKLYHSDAFRKYLNGLKPWKSLDDYLDSQAEYVYLLHKELNPKDESMAKKIKKTTRKALKEEHDYFQNNLEKITKKVLAKENKFKENYTKSIKQYFRNLREFDMNKQNNPNAKQTTNDTINKPKIELKNIYEFDMKSALKKLQL